MMLHVRSQQSLLVGNDKTAKATKTHLEVKHLHRQRHLIYSWLRCRWENISLRCLRAARYLAAELQVSTLGNGSSLRLAGRRSLTSSSSPLQTCVKRARASIYVSECAISRLAGVPFKNYAFIPIWGINFPVWHPIFDDVSTSSSIGFVISDWNILPKIYMKHFISVLSPFLLLEIHQASLLCILSVPLSQIMEFQEWPLCVWQLNPVACRSLEFLPQRSCCSLLIACKKKYIHLFFQLLHKTHFSYLPL